jgi:hypothetical protein
MRTSTWCTVSRTVSITTFESSENPIFQWNFACLRYKERKNVRFLGSETSFSQIMQRTKKRKGTARTTPFSWGGGGVFHLSNRSSRPYVTAHHQKSNDSGINPPWDDRVGGGEGWEGGKERCLLGIIMGSYGCNYDLNLLSTNIF